MLASYQSYPLIVSTYKSSIISMAMKFTILVSILVLVLIAAQADEAQGLGTITAAVNISGIVTCSVNGSANAPPFPNALVELSCGGNVIASAVTNAQGVFNITVNPLRVTLNNLLSSCRIIVATPLSNCNATLPTAGTLQSALQVAGTFIRGILNNVNLVPIRFRLVV
ncbi:putative phylloplanin [Helianthus annuus]|nr:putative phylloplanin [Helianthus annuus]